LQSRGHGRGRPLRRLRLLLLGRCLLVHRAVADGRRAPPLRSRVAAHAWVSAWCVGDKVWVNAWCVRDEVWVIAWCLVHSSLGSTAVRWRRTLGQCRAPSVCWRRSLGSMCALVHCYYCTLCRGILTLQKWIPESDGFGRGSDLDGFGRIPVPQIWKSPTQLSYEWGCVQ
jgi:hypothetical protein